MLGNCEGVGVDYLTLTVSSAAAADLRAWSELVEPGHAQRGFGASQLRRMLGGEAWRRWEPRQPSKVFGDDYESWEWAGAAARWPAEKLQGRTDVRPSRVDVAWDFLVNRELTADVIAEFVRNHAESCDISQGVAGQDGVNTRYLGSASSDRRIRFYRKDLQSQAWLLTHGPTLRVELVLKGDHAAAWWRAHSEGRGFAVAATHVQDLAGLQLQDDLAELPALDVAPEADAAQMVLEFARQAGPMLAVLLDAGADLADLAELVKSRYNRWAWSKHSKRQGRLAAATWPAVIAIVRAAMCRAESAEDGPGAALGRILRLDGEAVAAAVG